MITDTFDLIYCLNLDSRPDRWETSLKEFEKINVKPERFSAIKDDNPALGCLKSHREMLRVAAQQNKSVLIFEDDVEFLEGAKEVLEQALQELQNFSWAMLYLGGNILKPFRQTSEHLALLNHCQSTHAYGIHRDHVKPILEFLDHNEFFVDVLYADGVIPAVACYITIPMIAIQRADFSNIEQRVMTYDVPIARYNSNFIPLTKK